MAEEHASALFARCAHPAYDALDDEPEIHVFAHTIGAGGEALLSLIYPHDIPHHLQDGLLKHLQAALSRDGEALRRRFGKSATQRELEARAFGWEVWARRMRRTGLSRSTMYRKMQNGTFPKNVQISTRCAGWRESAVAGWLKNPMLYSMDQEAGLGCRVHVEGTRINFTPRLNYPEISPTTQ